MNSLESRFFDKLEFIKHKGLPASVVWGMHQVLELVLYKARKR